MYCVTKGLMLVTLAKDKIKSWNDSWMTEGLPGMSKDLDWIPSTVQQTTTSTSEQQQKRKISYE